MSRVVCLCGSTVRFGGVLADPATWYLFDEPTRRKWWTASTAALRWRAAAAHHCASGRHLWVFWDGPRGRGTVYQRVDDDAGDASPHVTAPGGIGGISRSGGGGAQEHPAARPRLAAPAGICGWHPPPIVAAPQDVDLPHWWALQAALFRALPGDPGATSTSGPLRPLRRCPDGDHLLAWWGGERAAATVYVAVGTTLDALDGGGDH